MKKYRIAIIGATGMVGKHFIKILEERQFPIESIAFFASGRSKEKKITFKDQVYKVLELTQSSFDAGFDFALFSAGADISLVYAPIAANKGATVIDNSSAWRMNPKVPLIVPEVNGHLLTKDDKIIANPNCSTIQSVVALAVIEKLFPIERVNYTTFQSVSGSGEKGVSDLIETTQGKKPAFYPKPIYDNVIPQIDDFLSDGYTKEEVKMIEETNKIMQTHFAINATCVRVPVLVSHSIAIDVTCMQPVDVSQLKQAYLATPHINFYEQNTYPTPQDAKSQDLVHVGRLRVNRSSNKNISLWVVADNVRKGAATNAVQIAEYLIKEVY